jgi:protein TonB
VTAEVEGDRASAGESTEDPAPPQPTASAAPRGSSGPETVAAPVIRPPAVLERIEPEYPERARKRGDAGTIRLRVLVGVDGTVRRVVVESGIPGSELEARAIDAVLRSSYRPATEDGRPMEAWTTETFVFGP